MFKKFCGRLKYDEESKKQSKGLSFGNNEPGTLQLYSRTQPGRRMMVSAFNLELYSSDRLLQALNEVCYCEQGLDKFAYVSLATSP